MESSTQPLIDIGQPDFDISGLGMPAQNQLQRVEVGLFRRMEAVFWYVVKLMIMLALLLLAALFAVIITWRWMVYGYNVAIARLASWMPQAVGLWELIDALSPSETVEERMAKQGEVSKVIIQTAHAAYEKVEAYYIWQYLSLPEMGVVLISGLITSYASYRLLKSLKRFAFKTVRRIRGIQYESMQAGSGFRLADIPDYQVAVKRLGLFADSLMGFGCRFNDFLVMPKHVLEVDGSLVKEVLLVSKKAKVLISLNIIPSAQVDDLVYCYLTPKEWSMLAVSKGKWSARTVDTHVSCTGMEGQSVGIVSRSDVRWQLHYTGSTLPGMSGAAYETNGVSGQIMGIHQGACGSWNVGWASSLIVAEGSRIAKPESSEDLGAVPFINNPKKGWNEIEALKVFKERPQMSREELLRRSGETMTWAEQMELEEECDFESSKVQPEARPLPKVNLISGQSVEGVPVEQAVITSADLDYLRAMKEAGVLEYVKRNTAQQKPTKLVCKYCGVTARTAEKMARHMANSHPVVKESAISVDTGKKGKVVKMQPFLVQGSSSQKGKKKSSAVSSSVSETTIPSQSHQVIPLEMKDSLKNIERSLKLLLESMAGPSSVKSPN
uniref:Uncharacterized protein n=1 Tax=Skokie sobemo-like virus TaxID=2789422 RepID=A0A7S9FTM4_9VIRU|nr:hypothetical protein [Skokie sobemo-like virus]